MIELHEHHVYIVDYFSCVRVHVALQLGVKYVYVFSLSLSLSLLDGDASSREGSHPFPTRGEPGAASTSLTPQPME